jgi:hypothetical protein
MAEDFIRFTGVEKFERDLHKLADEFELKIDQVIRKIGLDLFAGITKRTPVDTGYARANWLITTNSIRTDVLTRTEFPPGTNNRARAIAINKAMRHEVKPDKDRTSMFITNSVPYIIYLEQGRTHQINKGFMVQRTIADVQNSIDEEIKDLL